MHTKIKSISQKTSLIVKINPTFIYTWIFLLLTDMKLILNCYCYVLLQCTYVRKHKYFNRRRMHNTIKATCFSPAYPKKKHKRTLLLILHFSTIKTQEGEDNILQSNSYAQDTSTCITT